MSSDDYKQLRQIGKGAFGTAHIVEHKVTGERSVLKRVRLARQSAKERQCSVRELLLLSNLRHRNVLDFKGCWVEGGCNLCLLVELCESGDLFTQIKLRAGSGVHFSEEHLQEMAVQLLSAVAYLHRSSIAHRDLKSSNVLITGEGCLKIADFGLSTVLHDDGAGHLLTKTVVGTPNYMSPCVLQEKPYGMPNDIWGLGCVLYEVSALKPAFQAFNMAGLIKRVTTGAAPAMPSCYSENWRSLIRSMLTKEPELRPSAAELLELDWLQPAVRRVAARFGPELPEGAPDLISDLEDLPAEIMALFDTFAHQEREEKRRAEEARAKRKAAVAKWDPMARAAAAAATAASTPKLPPLKPHQPRKPPPKPARVPGAAGPVPPLPNRAAAGSPINGANPAAGAPAAAAVGRVMRRKTYHGDGEAAAAAAAAAGPGARMTSGGMRTAAGAAGAPGARPGVGAAGTGSASGRFVRPPPVVPQPEPLPASGGSLRLQGGRPSSAPPDSPIRRAVCAAPPGAGRDSPEGPHDGDGDSGSDLSDTDDSFDMTELTGGAGDGFKLVATGTSIDGGGGGGTGGAGGGGGVGRSDCSVSSQQHPHDLSGSDFDLLERAGPSHTSQSPPGAAAQLLGAGGAPAAGRSGDAGAGSRAGSRGPGGAAADDAEDLLGQWATPLGHDRSGGGPEEDWQAAKEQELKEQEATFRHLLELSRASVDSKPVDNAAAVQPSSSKRISSPGTGGAGFTGFIASAAAPGTGGGGGVRASHPAPAAGSGVRRSSSQGTGPPRPQSSGAPRPPVAASAGGAGSRSGKPEAAAATAGSAPRVSGSGMKLSPAPPAVPRPPSGSRMRTPSPGTVRTTSAAPSAAAPAARTASGPAR